ncbi:hypothetical protein GLOIN_2v1845638 [Rhizophagus clarus]|uniref:Uncharacterized protein n=1 Tax=Rhizophagus clarus TaxID=94130 RepID=A0A8H3L2Q8_9GLOM|nr:hypothetical protein GLOIN_2v1845638 [Rhizophagus clarus]
MKGQYQSMYNNNSSPINSYSSEMKKIYDNDDINSYNTTLDEVKELINYPSFKPSYNNSTNNNDYFINIYEDSKPLNFHKNLSSPLSSLTSSSNSSTTSLSLSLPSPSIHSPPLTTYDSLSNELSHYIKPYSYEPLYMIVPEIKKEFTKSNPKTNFFPKINLFIRPFTIYSSGKFDRLWRQLFIWSILLTLLCYSDPFEAKYIYKFVTPIRYFTICLTLISLTFRIIIIFAKNDLFKSYIKSYTTFTTTNTTFNTTSNTTNENNNTSTQTYTESQQQQNDATIINMEQNNQFETNTREIRNENSAGFVKPTLFGGCCDNYLGFGMKREGFKKKKRFIFFCKLLI